MLVPIIEATQDDLVPPNPNKLLSNALFAMVAFGFGEIFGSLIMGFILDKKGNKFGTVVILCIIIIMIPLTLFYIHLANYGVFTYVVTFLWGLMDSSTNTHTFSMLGTEFDSDTEPFAVFILL